VVVAPGADLRRILEESLPMLPEELGGGPMTGVTRDMSWAALALETAGEAPRLAVTVQGRDAEAAARLAKIARGGLDLLRKLIDSGPPDAKALAPFLAALAPEAQDDRVVVALPLDRLTDMAAEPLRSARVAARRMQGMNNLKQIALGMHIYADAMSQGGKPAFPPAFRAGKDGKPLLSWRVLILPYIDQKPLYDEFHLDEPWDSPHNKALIARMPAVFRSPAQSGPPGDGKTVYLVPRGASTMFPGAKGVALAEILDGTSNTIMVVEAAPDRAVEWTRPDDWDTGPGKVPTADFPFGAYSEGTNVAFADGAVRFLARTIDAKTLPHLLTRSGGEVVDFSKF
jgi:prepilin-type processing-associated H-X9-DG protein